jgi:hypothetical protein
MFSQVDIGEAAATEQSKDGIIAKTQAYMFCHRPFFPAPERYKALACIGTAFLFLFYAVIRR